MSEIVPTVTSSRIEEFNRQLTLVQSFANRIHIDLMDGVFAPTESPPLEKVNHQLMPAVVVDIHIMFKDPTSVIDEVLEFKPNLVIVHAETSADVPLLAAKLRERNIKTGIALLPETQVDDVKYILPHIQHVLIFGGHLGYHGGTADIRQLKKIDALARVSRHLEIGWDGGANEDNVKLISDSGVDIINVGSSIHKDKSPQEKFQYLSSLC